MSSVIDCCTSATRAPDGDVKCPGCGKVAKAVSCRTVAAMVTGGLAVAAHDRYRYCPTPRCPVVYYDDAGTVVERAGVRVRVNAKDPSPDVPLCYCFAYTRRAIAEEVAARGYSTASAAIEREVKAGHCACEVKSPSGRCCLGDVRSYEKEMVRQRGGAPPSGRGDSVTGKGRADHVVVASAGQAAERGGKK